MKGERTQGDGRKHAHPGSLRDERILIQGVEHRSANSGPRGQVGPAAYFYMVHKLRTLFFFFFIFNRWKKI